MEGIKKKLEFQGENLGESVLVKAKLWERIRICEKKRKRICDSKAL